MKQVLIIMVFQAGFHFCQGQNGLDYLRTPDSRFVNLPGYNFTPHYAFVDDTEGGQLRMHYVDEGPQGAPTVFMLHGNPTWSYMFRDVIVRLNAAGYRTIAIDYIGMGRSDKPTDFYDYTYDRHVYWTARIFQYLDSALNLGSVVILGHDYGTPIGIRLMNEYFPNRFDGFIVANASLPDGKYISPTHLNWRQFVRDNPDVPVGHVISNNVNPPLSQNEIMAYYAPFPDLSYKMAMRSFPEMVPEDTTWPEAIANKSAWKFLNSFTKPFMTIFGQFDAVGMPSARLDFIDKVPGAYGQPQPQLNVTHYAPEDKPEEVADEVITFLNDLYHQKSFINLLFCDFNDGFEEFSDGGSNCEWDSNFESIKLSSGSDSSSAAWLQTPLDLISYETIKVAFRFVTYGMEDGEKIYIEFWDGFHWQVVLTLSAGHDFTNGAYDYGYVRINKDSISFSCHANLRIRCDASDNTDIIYLNDFGIYARPLSNVDICDEPNAINDYSIFPNPAKNNIIIHCSNSFEKHYKITASDGKEFSEGSFTSDDYTIDISGFPQGIYFISILTTENNTFFTQKILKK